LKAILAKVQDSWYRDHGCVVKLTTETLRRTGRPVEAFDHAVKWFGLDIVADTHSSQNRALYDQTTLAALDAAADASKKGDDALAIQRLLVGHKSSYSYSEPRKKVDLALADIYLRNGEILKAKGHFEFAGEWERAKEMQQIWDAAKAQAAAKTAAPPPVSTPAVSSKPAGTYCPELYVNGVQTDDGTLIFGVSLDDPREGLTYKWTTSAVKTLKGQGTASIEVTPDTGPYFHASVEIGGLPAQCENVGSTDIEII
jgi:hypothetical protein